MFSFYMKYLIIGSKTDKASRNIVMNLMEFGGFDFHIIDDSMLKTENLDMTKISHYDFVKLYLKSKL